MKAAIRSFLVSGVVIVVALAAWNGARAEKGSLSNNPAAMISNLFHARIFDVSSDSTEVETETPAASETPQAGEDNQGQQQDDATPEVAGSPEPGDDNQAQHESASSPEASGEVTGTVTAIDANSVTVDGVVYSLTSGAEVGSALQVGDTVKLEFVTNADGTLSVREIKSGDQLGGSDDSGNDSSGDNLSGGGSDDGSGGHHGGGDGGGGARLRQKL